MVPRMSEMNKEAGEIDAKTNVLTASILIVDDEPANVKLLERMLRVFGYLDLRATTDPRDVLELCQQNSFDLIILDLNMPYLDGFEVMSQLQALGRSDLPPILILTAQHDQQHRVRALKGGAHDYVTKPFELDELLARVRNLLQVQLYKKYISGRNQWLEDRVHERTRELYNTRLQVVRRLGRAAEYRDNETGLHIVRMSQMSVAIGMAAGMSPEEGELLLNASPMHDIGKIGIPDQILLKPGKLEAHEWEIMKTHANIGADILSGDDSDLLSMARLIALSHHEKWDGSGYPNGLAGEEIPLVGRIVALADVFDALTSERPYKKAWSVSEAMEYMDANRGKHFDPHLLDLFHAKLKDIEVIKENFAEPETPVHKEITTA
jgi:putative two-component system response regulator